MSSETRVFVYGTLKSGRRNNTMLRDNGAVLLGTADVKGAYRLFDLGWFPGMVEDVKFKDGIVKGEVWRCSQEVLAYLDILEGHPQFYKREKIKTQHGKAWAYMLPLSYVEKLKPIESGEWTAGTMEEGSAGAHKVQR